MNELLEKYGLLDLTLTAIGILISIAFAWYYLSGQAFTKSSWEQDQKEILREIGIKNIK